MSGHFDDDQAEPPPTLSPSAFRRERAAAGIRDTDASLALAYAFAAAAGAAAAATSPPPSLIQIGPLDV